MPDPQIFAPIPFVYNVEEDRIYAGQPGERHADISNAKFSPNGIVEGVYDPKKNLQIRTETDMPFTVYHLTRLWYSLFPELEIRNVYRLVGLDRLKLASSQSIAASCIRAFSADPLWEAAQRLKHLGSVYIAGESVKRIAQRQDMGPDEFQIVVQGVEPDELREIVSQYAGVGAMARVRLTHDIEGVNPFASVDQHLASTQRLGDAAACVSLASGELIDPYHEVEQWIADAPITLENILDPEWTAEDAFERTAGADWPSTLTMGEVLKLIKSLGGDTSWYANVPPRSTQMTLMDVPLVSVKNAHGRPKGGPRWDWLVGTDEPYYAPLQQTLVTTGFTEPLVMQFDGKWFHPIDGNRRASMAAQAKLPSVPAYVFDTRARVGNILDPEWTAEDAFERTAMAITPDTLASTPTLTHATNFWQALHIVKDGALKPGSETGFENHGPQSFDAASLNDGVYLSVDAGDYHNYHMPGESNALIWVDTSKLDPTLVSADEDQGYKHVNDVQFADMSQIGQWGRDNYDTLETPDVTDASHTLGSVRYKGTIALGQQAFLYPEALQWLREEVAVEPSRWSDGGEAWAREAGWSSGEEFLAAAARYVKQPPSGASGLPVWKQSNILDPVKPTLSAHIYEDPSAPEPKVKQDVVDFVRNVIVDAMREAGWPDPDEHGYLSLVLTGSLTTFQYDDEGGSDFDVSLFIDAKRMPDWVRADLIKVMVENVDGTNLPDTQIPLQAYVVPADISREDLYKPGHRAGYDLDTGEWIVPPDPSMAKEVSSTQRLYAQSVVDKMKLLLLFAPEGAKQYWHEIHEKRRNSMRGGGSDHSDANVAYKALANAGLFEPISKLTGEHIASVKTSMGLNGELPEGLTFEVSPPEFSQIWGTATSTYEAFSGNEFVGSLQIDADEDKIIEVEVEPEWRRRGVATALLDRARQDYPRLRHSDELTDDGEAWANHVGSIPTAASPAAQAPFDMKTASMFKEAAWKDVQGKAVRLLRDGNVTVMANMPTYILGHVIGDHGEYETEISRHDPNSTVIEQWQCGCRWSQYAFQRTRKWKRLEGRPCSHVLALYWAAKSHPLDVSGEEEGYQAPRGQRVTPFSEQEQFDRNQGQIPGLTEQQADLGLDLDKLPRTFDPNDAPPPITDLPDKRDQIERAQPAQPTQPVGPIAPRPDNPFGPPKPPGKGQPERLRLFDITAPPGGQPVPPQNPTSIPGANPPGWQNPGNPTQFPGTYSSVDGVEIGDRVWIDVNLESPQDPEHWVPAKVTDYIPDTEGEMWDEDEYDVEFDEVPEDLKEHIKVDGKTYKRMPESWIHREDERNA